MVLAPSDSCVVDNQKVAGHERARTITALYQYLKQRNDVEIVVGYATQVIASIDRL